MRPKLCALLTAIPLLTAFQAAPPPSLSGFREPLVAVRVGVFEGATWSAWRDRVQAARAGGANAVVLRAFRRAGEPAHGLTRSEVAEGVYFQTEQAIVVDEVLAAMTRVAHEEGVRVLAEMETRAATYARGYAEDWRGYRWDANKNRMRRSEGLDPWHPEVRSGLSALFEDLGRSGVDGVVFAQDLALADVEGFGPWSGAAFSRETGYPRVAPADLYKGVRRDGDGGARVTKYGERFGPWAWWKSQRLLDLAETLARAARRANPSLAAILSLPAESALRPEEALALSSRSLDALASRDFDYIDFSSPEAETSAEAFRTELRARLEAAGIDPLRALVEDAREAGESGGEAPGEAVPTLITLAAAR